MYATLWDILLCILIDENLEEKFWKFAKSNKLLSKHQIQEHQATTQDEDRKKNEQSYINAVIKFSKSTEVPQHISKKILRIADNYNYPIEP